MFAHGKGWSEKEGNLFSDQYRLLRDFSQYRGRRDGPVSKAWKGVTPMRWLRRNKATTPGAVSCLSLWCDYYPLWPRSGRDLLINDWLWRKVDDSGLSFPEVVFLAAPQHPLAEHLEARPTIRLALNELQTMHMALDRTLRPDKRQPSFHRLVIFFERLCKAA